MPCSHGPSAKTLAPCTPTRPERRARAQRLLLFAPSGSGERPGSDVNDDVEAAVDHALSVDRPGSLDNAPSASYVTVVTESGSGIDRFRGLRW